MAEIIVDERVGIGTRLALATGAVFTTLLLVMGVDRLADLALPHRPEPIIFPPNTVVRHETTEFSYTARTNGLGFRDFEVPPADPDVLRIAAIGDSYTYGWGVELTESWPKVLEARLNGSGLAAQVFNLGQPGTTTDRYAEIAERAIAQLHPDVILVAVLQTDDLYQLMTRPTEDDSTGLERLAERLLPNASRWLQRARERRSARFTEDIRSAWRDISKRVLSELSPPELARYAALDAEVRQRFVSGNLNPSTVYLAISDPDYFEFPTAKQQQLVPDLVRSMASDFSRIRDAAVRSGAEVVVVAVPDGPYIDERALGAVRRLGFEASRDLLTTSVPDDLIARACAEAGIPFVSVTSAMRANPSETPAYFEFDGHPNGVGHARFAERLRVALTDGGYLSSDRSDRR